MDLSSDWNMVSDKMPPPFVGHKKFMCQVLVGGMQQKLLELPKLATCDGSNVRFLVGDWQQVIAWKEITT